MGLFKKKQSIDPVEFLVLRNELVELKERLDASEQAKASLEDRLSSLAATTMVLSSNSKSDTAEIVEKIESIESRLEHSLAVGSKVDELHQRVIDVEQGGAGVAAVEPRLAALAGRIDQVAELAAAPVAPDDELAGRLDQLSKSAETVDLLQRQISQINARMSAQADLADQITALSDRIGLLQQRNVDSDRINQRLDELSANTGTTEISERLALLAQRVAATEEATRVAAEQAATRQEIAQQIATLESRIAEATQQAAQVGALDQKIEALASASSAGESVAALEARLAELDQKLSQQTAVADQVAAIDARLAELGSSGNEIGNLRQMVELRNADLAGLRELIDVRSAEIADVRSTLEQLQQQPVAAATGADPEATARLDQRLGELAERVSLTSEDARAARDRAAAIAERVDQLAANPAVPADLSSRLDALDQRIAAADELARQAREQVGTTASAPDPDLARKLDELASRVAAADEAARQAREQAGSLEQRLGTVDPSTVNDQLSQLWSKVDASAEQARLANEQAAALAQQLSQSGERIGSVDRQIGEIWSRIVSAEEQSRSAQQQAASLEQRLTETASSMQGFAQTPAQANTAEIDRQLADLRNRLDLQASLPDRLADLDRRLSSMPDRGGEISQLQERLGQLASSMPDTSSLSSQLADLSQRVSSSETDARAALTQARALDERIQNVSTQLANQLGELSRDMDSLANRAPVASAAVVDDEALQTLRSGQVKLAAEQARYEISFREDLAALAEQVRQLRGR